MTKAIKIANERVNKCLRETDTPPRHYTPEPPKVKLPENLFLARSIAMQEFGPQNLSPFVFKELPREMLLATTLGRMDYESRGKSSVPVSSIYRPADRWHARMRL